ncbi:hypothetical protein EJ08DRAFT_649242 [Tothia fuscella]|uniref:Uncharacterized protein n=1 Tax=Tothia fuscella TaxID=1048955 RepID=A0A9P4NSJ5_9PEZI|nr:hypothetical protein EJ08DRAFT_649242 [Tothia fuscella]
MFTHPSNGKRSRTGSEQAKSKRGESLSSLKQIVGTVPNRSLKTTIIIMIASLLFFTHDSRTTMIFEIDPTNIGMRYGD